MIRRFLFVLRRVIVKVMARAAVPQNTNGFGAQSPAQLGFDFGVSPSANSQPTTALGAALPNAATTNVASAAAVPFASSTGSYAPNAVREPSVLPFNRATSNDRAGTFVPTGSVSSATHDSLPQLATSLNDGSPFGVAGGLSAPEPAAPVAPPVSKSRGRAAVRARTAVMFSRLQELGLRGIESLVLMRTRTVMVSLIGQTLRVHEGYADAPEPVLRAIVTFATARHRATRAAARDEILKHDIERAPAARRVEPARPGDIALIASLMQAHREMNVRHFDGSLHEIPIKLSGRMATRLGHFDPGSRLTPPEIVMSRRHVVKHGWKEAMHTLLHEMVHQWQHETGRPVDHLGDFRKKCREVGITPAARRDVTPLKTRRRSGAA